MSFQAYLNNVEKNTGKTMAQLTALAISKGFTTDANSLSAGVKAGDVLAWLKEEFNLGHGHAMSVVAYLKGKRA